MSHWQYYNSIIFFIQISALFLYYRKLRYHPVKETGLFQGDSHGTPRRILCSPLYVGDVASAVFWAWWAMTCMFTKSGRNHRNFYINKKIRSVELSVCPMQLLHFWSRDVHPVQNLLLCIKFHENPMIFHWDMAICRFSEWRLENWTD